MVLIQLEKSINIVNNQSTEKQLKFIGDLMYKRKRVDDYNQYIRDNGWCTLSKREAGKLIEVLLENKPFQFLNQLDRII